MSRVHIFGASGFVGRALTPLLDKHNIAYAALPSKDADLTSADAAPKIAGTVKDGDSILMLSAHTPEKGDARDMTVKNIQMARHLLAGIERRKIAHCVYVSTDAVYPLTADVIDEQTPPCPESLYGHAHAVREQYFREHFAPEQLAIFRPCAIYGRGDPHNAYGVSRFIRSAMERGDIALFGEGEEYRDHIHVEDFAAILLAALRQETSGVFNVASGKSWRFAEIAAIIQAGIGKKVTVTRKPRAMPVFHRHVNTLKLRRAFPSCRIRAVDEGIRQLLKEGAPV